MHFVRIPKIRWPAKLAMLQKVILCVSDYIFSLILSLIIFKPHLNWV